MYAIKAGFIVLFGVITAWAQLPLVNPEALSPVFHRSREMCGGVID
jgi:hypothetical protein